MASIPSKRFSNYNWLKIHHNHCFYVYHDSINSIIIGDSIVAGLTRHSNVWNNLFRNKFVNLGIRGDCVENVLWRVRDIAFPPRLKNVVILCVVRIRSTKILSMVLSKDWLPLVHLLKIGTITLTYLFVDYFLAMNTFLLIERLLSK